VACPYFYPVERIHDGAWIQPPRLPLGGPYSGVCRAVEGDLFQPGESALRECCNIGYARGRCVRFPAQAVVDALRFSIEADADNVIEIVFVREKEWSPSGYGRAQWSAGMMTCDQALDPLIERQMEIFVANYLARKSEPAAPSG
jgi:hypothetical protein